MRAALRLVVGLRLLLRRAAVRDSGWLRMARRAVIFAR